MAMLFRCGLLFFIAAIATLGLTAAASPLDWNPDVPAHLYIAETAAPGGNPGQVAVFPLNARGDVSPEYVISGPHTSVDIPVAVAFDGNGDLYVYDSGHYASGCDRIVEFAPGAHGDATPIRVIEGIGDTFCNNIDYNFAVTRRGEVYVPEMLDGDILVYGAHQHGQVLPEKVLTYVEDPRAIDFDTHGNLWNVQLTYRNVIDEYSSSGKHLARVKNPGQVYLFTNAHDTLYAPARKPNVVTLTSLRTMKTEYSFTYPRNSYWSVSVDAAGYMYFFYFPPRHQNLAPIIEIYPPGGSSPAGSLGGSLTGLTQGSYGSARVGP